MLRVVFSLYMFEGYDHEEIAEILNFSPKASKYYLNRAKRKLVEIIEEEKTKTKSSHAKKSKN
jgi:DNA-directed RNA polymerase specialized sigma24 family protein